MISKESCQFQSNNKLICFNEEMNPGLDINDNSNPHVDLNNKAIISGLEQLPNKVNEIIITSGSHNVAVLKQYGYNVIDIVIEIQFVSELTIASIKNRCEHLYCCFDINNLGLKATNDLCSLFPFIRRIMLPDSLKLKRNTKTKKVCTNVNDYFNHYSANQFDQLIDQARFINDIENFNEKIKFWGTNKRKQPTLLISKIGVFCGFVGIYKYDSGGSQSSIIKICGKSVEFITIDYIQDLLKAILTRFCKEDLDQLIEQIPKYINKNNLIALSKKRELNFYCGERTSQLFIFNNVSVYIDQNCIRKTDLDSYNSFIKKDQSLNFYPTIEEDYFTITKTGNNYNINLIEKSCDYLIFLKNVSSIYWRKDEKTQDELQEESLHLLSKITAIGYLLHKYKDPSRSYLIMATDYQGLLTGKPEGGSGKSIFGKAFKKIANVKPFNGKRKDFFNKDSSFGRLDNETNIAVIEDIRKDFDFESLYTLITDSVIVRSLYENERELPEEQSLKFLGTTNFMQDISLKSTKRRIKPTFFSDYYSEERLKPSDEFHYAFFTPSMPLKQLNMFYNLMFQCTKAYLKWGIIEAPNYNVEMRILTDMIGADFIEWADDYLIGHDFQSRVKRKDFDKSFKSNLSEVAAKKISAKQMKDKLKAYCKLRGYLFNPDQNGGAIKSNSIEYYQIVRKRDVEAKTSK